MRNARVGQTTDTPEQVLKNWGADPSTELLVRVESHDDGTLTINSVYDMLDFDIPLKRHYSCVDELPECIALPFFGVLPAEPSTAVTKHALVDGVGLKLKDGTIWVIVNRDELKAEVKNGL